jgi:hypothetical protein
MMSTPLVAALASAAAVTLASPVPLTEPFVSTTAIGFQTDNTALKQLNPEFTALVSRVFDIAQWYGCMYFGSVINGLRSLGATATCDQLDTYVQSAERSVSREVASAGLSASLKGSLDDLRDEIFRTVRNAYLPLCRDGRVNVAELRTQLMALQGALCSSVAAPPTLPPRPMPTPTTTPSPTPKPTAPKPGTTSKPTPLPTASQALAEAAKRGVQVSKAPAGSAARTKAELAYADAMSTALVLRATEAVRAADAARGVARRSNDAKAVTAANAKFDAITRHAGEARKADLEVKAAVKRSDAAAAMKALQRVQESVNKATA